MIHVEKKNGEYQASIHTPPGSDLLYEFLALFMSCREDPEIRKTVKKAWHEAWKDQSED